MNIVVCNPPRTIRFESKSNTIRIFPKGIFFIGAGVIEMVHLVNGCSICYDTDDVKNWYIKRGTEIKFKKQKSGSCSFGNRSLQKELCRILCLDPLKFHTLQVKPDWKEWKSEHYFPIVIDETK